MTRTILVHRGAACAGILVALAGLIATAVTVRGNTSADLRAGVYTDAGALGLGGGVLTRISPRTNWFFNPNLEAAFGDRNDEVALNADFHYDFPTGDSYSVYMGAGPALLFRHPDGGETDPGAAMNMIGGVAGRHGEVRPFLQMKGVVSDHGQVALVGGVRF